MKSLQAHIYHSCIIATSGTYNCLAIFAKKIYFFLAVRGDDEPGGGDDVAVAQNFPPTKKKLFFWKSGWDDADANWVKNL